MGRKCHCRWCNILNSHLHNSKSFTALLRSPSVEPFNKFNSCFFCVISSMRSIVSQLYYCELSFYSWVSVIIKIIPNLTIEKKGYCRMFNRTEFTSIYFYMIFTFIVGSFLRRPYYFQTFLQNIGIDYYFGLLSLKRNISK